MRKISLMYRDRQRSPKEEATYWIEYVIKHGKNSLRSSTADLQWWQSENIDVYVFIITLFFLVFILVVYLICFATKIIVDRKKLNLKKKVFSVKKFK